MNDNCDAQGISTLPGVADVPHGGAGPADYGSRPEVLEFARELAEEADFDERELLSMLGQAEYQQSVIDSISRPAERELTWAVYQDIFLTGERTSRGAAFMSEHRAALREAFESYGVPPEIVTAIIGVETMYGRFSGDYRVLDALATLAFDYPPRSAFFRGELKQFFRLAPGRATAHHQFLRLLCRGDGPWTVYLEQLSALCRRL